MSFDKIGHTTLTISGFHAGSVKWIGEQQNVFAILVEGIPKDNHSKLLPKIRNELGADLKDAKILFMDDKYLMKS